MKPISTGKAGLDAFNTILRREFQRVSGLATVPGLLSLSLWVFALATLWLDRTFPEFSTSAPFKIFNTDYDTARVVLSTVASASITTLGLVYSIVLVVFTTAAGNIGPRLLQRFTADRINQFTAGLFGGTFLYALTVLHQTDEATIPALSIAFTYFFAGLSVLQLILFVHRASRSVTVDEEIAAISARMEAGIKTLLHGEEGLDDYEQEPPKPPHDDLQFEADLSGYITGIDLEKLTKLAARNGLFLDLRFAQGDFVVKGQVFAATTGKPQEDDEDEFRDKVLDLITISEFRSPDADVEFSINLLVEIALRALSPGVNDTFTAIACIDRVSSALVEPVRKGLRDDIRADEDKVPRIRLPGLTLEDLMSTAFHPLRRASIGNVLMAKHLIDALARLAEIGDGDAVEIMRAHRKMVIETAQKGNLTKTDLAFLRDRRAEAFE